MIEHPVKVARVGEIAPGKGIAIPPEVSGHPTPIALFHTEDDFRAVDDTCTHLGASLAKGGAVGGEVACWLHNGKFCLDTGEATLYPARASLTTFPVEVRREEVWLLPTAGD